MWTSLQGIPSDPNCAGVHQTRARPTGNPYYNLGADYFTSRVDPERRARQLTRQLHDLGHQVTLTKAA
jgi:hypothetical protein